MAFFRELLDSSKTLSFGRFMALLMVVFCLGWDTSNLVFAWRANMHLPPGLPPFPLLPDPLILAAQAGFGATFYGITKYGDFKNPPTPPPV